MPGFQTHPEAFSSMNSCLHQLDARVKLQLLIIFLLTAALLPQGAWAAFILLAAILTAAMLSAHVPIQTLVKRVLVIEVPFVLVLLPLLFRSGGQALISFRFAERTLSITQAGSSAFFSILVKTGLSIQAAVLFNAVTQPQEALAGLRALGYPRLLSAVLNLMWRYVNVITNEALRMLTARTVRSGRDQNARKKGGGSILWRAHVAGSMAGSLFLRSLARSERIYQAMLSRGYDGEVRLAEMTPLGSGQKWLLAATAAGALLFVLMAFMIY